MRWTDEEFVTFDTETTGFKPTDRVIELSFLRFRAGEIVDRYTTRIDPGIPIPEEASLIHGIRDADVMGGPRFSDVADIVHCWIDDDRTPLVGHNLAYDLRMLSYDMPPSLWPMERPTLCTLQFAKKYHPVLRQRHKGHKLIDVATFFGVPFNSAEAHGAEYDAMITGKIVPLLLAAPYEFGMQPPLVSMGNVRLSY